MSSQLSREISIAQYVYGRIDQVLCNTSSAFHSDLYHIDKASKLPQNNFRPVKCSNPKISRSRSAMTSDGVLHNLVLGSQINRQCVLMLSLSLLVPQNVSPSPHLLRIHGSLLTAGKCLARSTTQQHVALLPASSSRPQEAWGALDFVPPHVCAMRTYGPSGKMLVVRQDPAPRLVYSIFAFVSLKLQGCRRSLLADHRMYLRVTQVYARIFLVL